MPRYVAFLRGVTPGNAKMTELKRCFETAGFTDVRTVLASGNVVFNARSSTETTLERKIEAAMETVLERTFYTIVRPVEFLHKLLESDPYTAFEIPSNAKRVITFLRRPCPGNLTFPIEFEGASILGVGDREAFTFYVPSPLGPVFMTLIERTFGKDVTTRTWETIKKCAKA